MKKCCAYSKYFHHYDVIEKVFFPRSFTSYTQCAFYCYCSNCVWSFIIGFRAFFPSQWRFGPLSLLLTDFIIRPAYPFFVAFLTMIVNVITALMDHTYQCIYWQLIWSKRSFWSMFSWCCQRQRWRQEHFHTHLLFFNIYRKLNITKRQTTMFTCKIPLCADLTHFNSTERK